MRLSGRLENVLEAVRDLPDRPALGAAGRVFAVMLVLFGATRMVLTFRLETTGWTQHPFELLVALALGLVNDLGSALVMSALAYLLVVACARRGLRVLGQGLLLAGLVVAVFGAVAEVFFWDEFASRFNGIAIYYLIFPREVIGNLRESFDLNLLLPPIVLAGVGLWWLFRSAFRRALRATGQAHRGLRAVVCGALGIAVGVQVGSLLPARVLENRELNQVALNGPANMVRAALTNDSAYDGVYPGIDQAKAVPLMRSIVAQDNTTFLDPPARRSVRRYVDNGSSPKRLNIVIVLEESFGSIFVDSLDRKGPGPVSPQLDRLAKHGLFFTNVYASGQRSVRGLEAVWTSFTPIPGISTARRPGSRNMYSLPFLLKRFGYRSAMMYAGDAAFDNMGTFWAGIGFDHVWDQKDLRHHSFTTAWGVSDEDLFADALERMDENTRGGQPFLLGMFTVSNHRPYKFPQDHVKWNPAFGKRGNTAHYADWAFGHFIEQARSHPWFDDTVFVFVADHGYRVNGAAEVPLYRYRIPLLFYSPKHVPARKVSTLGAQIDLAPTLLGLLGMSYESHFFGIDLMRVPPGGGRIAVAHNFSVAFARPGHAVVLNPDGTQKGYHFVPGEEALAPEAVDPEVSAEARALTQTAHHMFYHKEYQLSGSELAHLNQPGSRKHQPLSDAAQPPPALSADR